MFAGSNMDVTIVLQPKATLAARIKQLSFAALKSDFGIAFLLSALVVATWLPRMYGPLDLRWDGAVYYELGTALAEGKGYRLLNEPGEIEEV